MHGLSPRHGGTRKGWAYGQTHAHRCPIPPSAGWACRRLRLSTQAAEWAEHAGDDLDEALHALRAAGVELGDRNRLKRAAGAAPRDDPVSRWPRRRHARARCAERPTAAVIVRGDDLRWSTPQS